MYAVIKTGGKQLRVEEGQTILVEKLAAEVDSIICPVRRIDVSSKCEFK